MRLFKYFQEQSILLLTFMIIAIFLPATLLLWHVSLDLVINSTVFMLVVFAFYLAYGFFKWRQTQIAFKKSEDENLLLRTQLAELTAASQDLDDIIRIWSHQMKVPMAAIDMMSQTRVDPRELQNQVFNLNYYLTLLLEYQRITNLSNDFSFEEFSVKKVASSLVKRYSSFFIQKNLSVNISAEPDWLLKTDQRWFNLALEQIINNAVKYTPSGSVTITIQPGKITIGDTGIGILPEDLPRLFDHGFTGYNGRIQEKSSGIGLYLSQLILEKLDFKINIASTINVGTQVSISK